MIILGIDPGSRVTGYGIVDATDDSDKRAVAFDTIRLDGIDSHPQRLLHIYEELCERIDEHSPSAFAIEMPVYGRNPQSMLKLGRAQAAAMMAALTRDVPVAEYTPKEVKKAVTGNGNASKTQVRAMVDSILPSLDGSPSHDAADALAIALCHSHRDAHGTPDGGSDYTGWASFVEANPDRVSE